MKFLTFSLSTLALICGVFAAPIFDRRVQVSNATEKKITKVSISSDGVNFTSVNLPHGIKPRQTV
jgi:hypothetical protein